MAKIIHIADLHIGVTLDFLSNDKREIFQKAIFPSLEDVVFTANNNNIDAILIAGDLFDVPTPPTELVSKTFSILGKALCPILISPGNHDFYSKNSAYNTGSVPINVHIFKESKLEAYPLLDNETVVYGAAFNDIKATIPLDAKLDNTKVNICCVHGEISTDSGYNSISALDIAKSGFDYIALGHNHSFSGIKKVENTFFACTGSFFSTNSTETGEKGYLIGNVVKNNTTLSLKSSKLPVIENIILDISDISSDEELDKLVCEKIPKNNSNTCAFVTVCGEKNYSPNLKALKNTLDEVFFACIFIDNTVEPIDIWAGLNDDGLRGETLRKFKKDYDDASEDKKELILRAVKYTLNAFLS